MIEFLIVLALVSTILDWSQTRYIAKNPIRYRELNPILGEHPTVGEVNAYFIFCIVAGSAVVYFVADARVFFLAFVCALECFMVIRNRKLGIGLA